MADDAWRQHLVQDPEGIAEILRSSRRIAVLGIKTEEQAGQPAFDVPRVLQEHGYEIVPVPVYYPEAQTILGERVYRAVADVPGDIDVVEVFRKGPDVAAHVDDLIAAKPKVVWMQLGIQNAQAAERLARTGIKVVQNRCMKVELARLGSPSIGAGETPAVPGDA